MPHIDAREIIRRWERMKSDRATWETHWQDIADLVTPSRDFTITRSPGEKRRQRIFDSTAPFSADRLAGALNGLLTNPSLLWFMLITEDEQLNENEEARAWLEDSSRKMLHLFNTPRFGFYSAIHEVYSDLVSFGTAVLFTRTPPGAMRFQAVPLGSAFIDEDHMGIVDTLYRDFTWSSAQVLEAFGKKTPETIRKNVEDGKPEKECELIQAVLPRRDRDPFRKDGVNKPWASFVVSVKDREIINESGFDEFPFACPRWSKMAGEKYGRGPAMSMLPEIKMVNAMAKTIIIAAEKVADPPMIMPDDGFLGPLRTRPGGINYFRAGSKDRAEPLFTGARPDLGDSFLDSRRDLIRSGFFLDMFTLPNNDRMTATEIQQRQREQQSQLSPSLTRLYSELIGPLINRTFQVLSKEGAFLEPPAVIAGKKLTVEYLSPLALSQRASESANFFQWMQLVAPIAQADPSVLANINVDELAHWGKGMFNLPQRIFKTREEVEELRQQAQEAEQVQQAADVAATGAGAAKDASVAGFDIADALGA